MVEESASLIESFDEGWSNRQVWNNVAMLAAGMWLGDASLATRAIEGTHGLRRQLLRGVTDDGLWFEGENYHFFALRGFQLAGELLRSSGVDLYAEPDVGSRLTAMYAAPLTTAFPDLTMPAGKPGRTSVKASAGLRPPLYSGPSHAPASKEGEV